ncbi:metal ABC transporter substrate-binding protein [Chthonobacter rhizosphaerae]|uniref:metal ABC transporter substrate-binding protein n=1 Tax=Chthonobacter rhizosphaerae TaxID=2735553 RepID=UPI0015EFAF08|nr:metal ABC transporter substrate-binding protein [Chthonobacter rhizosphaerae]
MRVTTLLASAALLALASGTAAAEPLKVVATFSILGDMVSRVGGDRVEVTTLVGPNGDAHVYQPTPADARSLLGADLVVVNGLGFEGFLDRLLTAAEYKGPVVTAAAAVTPIAGGEEEEEHGHGEAAHADGHGHGEAHAEAGHAHGEAHAEAEHDHEEAQADGHDDHHGGLDPHAWQSIANAKLYVEAVTDGLCGVDASGCDGFRANAATYTAELDALEKDVKARIAAIPSEKRRVITSHDAFGYFAAAYGVRFLAPQGVSTESEASASDVARLVRQVRETGVKVLFVENVSDPRLLDQIARESGARIGGALYSDALSPAGEPGATYIDMMRHNADALVSAMEQNS